MAVALLNMKRVFFFLQLISISFVAFTQVENIIPKPQQTVLREGNFIISPQTVIIKNGTGVENAVTFFNNYLQSYYQFRLKLAKVADKTKNAIVINVGNIDNNAAGAYRLDITGTTVSIKAKDSEGIFYALQSLIQLLPPKVSDELPVPCLTIVDAPRFTHRGAMLDVGRYFFPVSFVKRFLDYMALHKMNVFHWHLTDDHGWRIEIKKYPKLTEVGSWRDGTVTGLLPGTGNTNEKHGGFYTQEEIKAVVKYAAARNITVIPEIEMPGHASAAIAAYPWLSCFPGEKTMIPGFQSEESKRKQDRGQVKVVQEVWGVQKDVFVPKETTFRFLEEVLDEVMALFPSKYIHIGGDECAKDNWKRSEFCQQLIKQKGLKDEHGLQSYFIQRIEKYLNKKGRNIIGWDEILEGGLAPNATVMSWRGEEGGIAAAHQKHNVIMSPSSHCYFDYSQVEKDDSLTIGGHTSLQKVYSYDPCPGTLHPDKAKYILGAQANLWTEYISNPAKAEYMLFPRLAAIAEVLWTEKDNKDWEDFRKRVPVYMKRLDLWGVNYYKK